jgi:hypothetical protein
MRVCHTVWLAVFRCLAAAGCHAPGQATVGVHAEIERLKAMLSKRGGGGVGR